MLYGAPRGLDGRRTQQFAGADARPARRRRPLRLRARWRATSTATASTTSSSARPASATGEPSSGALHVALRRRRRAALATGTRVIRRPAARHGRTSACACAPATSTATGSADLVGGRPGARRGAGARDVLPRRRARARALPRAAGAPASTSSLAVGDVNGDRRADIVQGDSAHVDPAGGLPVSAGEVRLWLGGRARPAPDPDHDHAGHARRSRAPSEPGDEFGAVVEAGRRRLATASPT